MNSAEQPFVLQNKAKEKQVVVSWYKMWRTGLGALRGSETQDAASI